MKIIKNVLCIIVLSLFIIGPSVAAEKAVGYFGWHATGKYLQLGETMGFWRGEFSGSFDSDAGEGGLFHKASMRCQLRRCEASLAWFCLGLGWKPGWWVGEGALEGARRGDRDVNVKLKFKLILINL